ncbi:MAG: nitroreductase family protein [Chloroflexi bacterium]|nr:nitroreductase family protein [Chloroflexota bacterium]MDA1239868.1 nitroreductase family protein [Chloroflexota bacterium]
MPDRPTADQVDLAIRSRRSIRGLEGPPLDAATVDALVALACTAPAPHHTQPWRFAEVTPGRRDALATAMAEAWRADMVIDGVPVAQQERALARSRRQVEEAPTLLLGCLVHDGLRDYTDDRRAHAEWGLAQHSFGAALQNILLAAAARGLGAFWISAPLYAQDAVRTALDLDAGWEPQAFVALGHPSADYRPFDRPLPDLGKHLVRR